MTIPVIVPPVGGDHRYETRAVIIHPDTNQVPRLFADRPGEIVLTGNTRPPWYPIRVRMYITRAGSDSGAVLPEHVP